MSKEIKIGEIFSSNNFGDFEIISESPEREKKGRHRRFNIRFINTGGMRYNISTSDIRSGEIKDYFMPSVANVGYVGNITCSIDKFFKKEYQLWKNMIQRCYNETNKNYKYYGAKGVTASKRWHCFEYFLEDIPNIKWYNEELFDAGLLELDKDIFGNSKLYSLETCCFIDKKTNIEHQHKNTIDFIAIDPYGNRYDANNVSEFAKNYGLNKLCIYSCLQGDNKQHKGWKFYYSNKEEIKHASEKFPRNKLFFI